MGAEKYEQLSADEIHHLFYAKAKAVAKCGLTPTASADMAPMATIELPELMALAELYHAKRQQR